MLRIVRFSRDGTRGTSLSEMVSPKIPLRAPEISKSPNRRLGDILENCTLRLQNSKTVSEPTRVQNAPKPAPWLHVTRAHTIAPSSAHRRLHDLSRALFVVTPTSHFRHAIFTRPQPPGSSHTHRGAWHDSRHAWDCKTLAPKRSKNANAPKRRRRPKFSKSPNPF